MSSVTYQVEFQNRKSDIDLLLQKYPGNPDLISIQSQCSGMLKRAVMEDNLFQMKLHKFDQIINQYEQDQVVPTTTMAPIQSQPIPIPQISTKIDMSHIFRNN